MRTRYHEVLQNLHFAESTKEDKTVKGYKIRPIIDHFNESFHCTKYEVFLYGFLQ